MLYMQVVRYMGAPVFAPLIRLDHSIGQIEARAVCGLTDTGDNSLPWTVDLVLEVQPNLCVWAADDKPGASAQDKAENVASLQAMEANVRFDTPLMAPKLPALLAIMKGNQQQYRKRLGTGEPLELLKALKFDTFFFENVRDCYVDIINGVPYTPWFEALYEPVEDRGRVLRDDLFAPIAAAFHAAADTDPIKILSPLYQWATVEQSIPALEAHLG